ncbi:hypothetical protein CN245_32070, partial [Sinorhizobium meliloti]
MLRNVTAVEVSKYIYAADELARRSGLHLKMGDDSEEYVGFRRSCVGASTTRCSSIGACPGCSRIMLFWRSDQEV